MKGKKKGRRTSKYLGKEFDNGWKCTYVGIASVHLRRKHKNAVSVGHINYYYIFERLTSDNKALKMIRLDSSEAAKVYRGERRVEELVQERMNSSQKRFTQKISYHFINNKEAE